MGMGLELYVYVKKGFMVLGILYIQEGRRGRTVVKQNLQRKLSRKQEGQLACIYDLGN